MPYYTQEQINDGQQRINGALCVVDWKIIEALKALTDALSATPGVHRVELERVNSALADAYRSSAEVAEIRPPGCEPALEVDPNHWSIAA
jgi:hypothetical protein